ncbi:MAG: type III pantothenate kinase [Actinomycetota bacterium]
MSPSDVLLAVDVGNTQTHLGVFKGEELFREWRASTDQSRTADELALMFGEFLTLADLSFSRQITGVVISSVVPHATQELRAMTDRYFGFPALVVGPGVKTGISVLYENPHEVGADRIANAVAAHELFPNEAVTVVDFGTATTLEVISARGEYLGGAIVPGIEIAAAALFRMAAQIRRVELVAPPMAVAKNTVNSVQSGIVYGTAAMVDGLIERIVDEVGEMRVLATGGLAPNVVSHCRRVERMEPLLTLTGLRLIFDKNAGADESMRQA